MTQPSVDYGPGWCEVTIPLRLVNGANSREHWAKRAKRAKEQRQLTAMVLRSVVPCTLASARRITITRIGVRRMDSDGLAISAKHVRDGVADWAGVDDGDPAWLWRYEQATGKGYAIKVRVEMGTAKGVEAA